MTVTTRGFLIGRWIVYWGRSVVRLIGLATSVALLLLIPSFAALGQQTGRVPRIGVMTSYSPEEPNPAYALRDGLRELGYVEGHNIAIEWRWARGDASRFADLAAEFVRLKVDVIVAGNNPAIAAAQKATKTIPIVMGFSLDAVRSGFVVSLARPEGNITGMSAQHPDVAGKGLQLLKEAVPNLANLAILWDPALTGMRRSVEETEIAAKAFRAHVQVLEARSPEELGPAFEKMAAARVDAVVIHGSSMLFVNRARLAELAMKHRLPALCSFRPYVEAGCLVSYWISPPGQYRRAAYFVDRILKGTKPADLPVEQPTKFELVINAKTAKALGLTIPSSLVLQADQVIE